MRPLVKPRLIGRLGNNLFQIAVAIGYAKKYNVGWGIKKGYKDRGFQINQIDRFMPHLPACDSYFKTYTEFQEEWAGYEFNYHEIPFHPNGVELVGFWQSEKYFKHAEKEVIEAIRLPFIQGYRDYVSIHVRRGDYVQHSGSFPPITVEYIEQAMRYISSNKYLIFSDDILWCKETLRHLNNSIQLLEFSEGRNEWEDLALMASCGHNIIANSSFSWWGAWLNTNPDKIVVSPSHKRGNWFGMEAGVKHDCIDLIPEGWIQIEFR